MQIESQRQRGRFRNPNTRGANQRTFRAPESLDGCVLSNKQHGLAIAEGVDVVRGDAARRASGAGLGSQLGGRCREAGGHHQRLHGFDEIDDGRPERLGCLVPARVPELGGVRQSHVEDGPHHARALRVRRKAHRGRERATGELRNGCQFSHEATDRESLAVAKWPFVIRAQRGIWSSVS